MCEVHQEASGSPDGKATTHSSLPQPSTTAQRSVPAAGRCRRTPARWSGLPSSRPGTLRSRAGGAERLWVACQAGCSTNQHNTSSANHKLLEGNCRTTWQGMQQTAPTVTHGKHSQHASHSPRTWQDLQRPQRRVLAVHRRRAGCRKLRLDLADTGLARVLVLLLPCNSSAWEAVAGAREWATRAYFGLAGVRLARILVLLPSASVFTVYGVAQPAAKRQPNN